MKAQDVGTRERAHSPRLMQAWVRMNEGPGVLLVEVTASSANSGHRRSMGSAQRHNQPWARVVQVTDQLVSWAIAPYRVLNARPASSLVMLKFAKRSSRVEMLGSLCVLDNPIT